MTVFRLERRLCNSINYNRNCGSVKICVYCKYKIALCASLVVKKPEMSLVEDYPGKFNP